MIGYQVYDPSHYEDLREPFVEVWGVSRSAEYDQKHWNNTIVGTAARIVAVASRRIIDRRREGWFKPWICGLHHETQQENIILITIFRISN
jgi:hypothetical protein